RRKSFRIDGSHASRRKPSGSHGKDQESQRKRQVGDYHEYSGSPREQTVRQLPEAVCTPYPKRQSERPGEQRGRNCQDQRVSSAQQQQWRYGAVVGERESHLAVEDGVQPGEVPDGKRLVETVLITQRGHCLRRNLGIQAHFVEVRSRGQRGEEERQYGNAGQQEQSVAEPAQQVAHHRSKAGGAARVNLGTAASSW